MENDLETTEEMFDAIPEEVKHYIYSSDFREALDAMVKDATPDTEKQDSLKASLYGFIAQANDADEIVEAINNTTTEELTRQKIKDWVDTNVTQKIFALVADAYAHDDDDETVGTNDNGITPVTAPAPVTLSSLADRLKQASITTSSRRDYGIDIETKPSSTKSAIDPYHEAIDNE